MNITVEKNDDDYYSMGIDITFQKSKSWAPTQSVHRNDLSTLAQAIIPHLNKTELNNLQINSKAELMNRLDDELNEKARNEY